MGYSRIHQETSSTIRVDMGQGVDGTIVDINTTIHTINATASATVVTMKATRGVGVSVMKCRMTQSKLMTTRRRWGTPTDAK